MSLREIIRVYFNSRLDPHLHSVPTFRIRQTRDILRRIYAFSAAVLFYQIVKGIEVKPADEEDLQESNQEQQPLKDRDKPTLSTNGAKFGYIVTEDRYKFDQKAFEDALKAESEKVLSEARSDLKEQSETQT